MPHTESLRIFFALLSLLPTRPRELYDRATGYADLALERLVGRPPDYGTVTWEGAIRLLETPAGPPKSSANPRSMS